GPGEMYNGAARLLDSAIPWEIEAAAREAVEAAVEEAGEAVKRTGEADGGAGGRREQPDSHRRKDNPPLPAQAA
ncbi:MAG: hypothetical protein OXN18_08010, partial [Gemmatimonadota bacterium]|nr:hypothetical protein [Gemmatimonadota bacterium]